MGDARVPSQGEGSIRCLAILSAFVLLLVCAPAARPAAAHSRFTPNPRAARYWTHRYFGHGWQARLMLCVAYTESRYELAATNGVNVGPWQVNLTAHPWVNGYRIRRSWRYAAAVSWHISGYGTNFHAWTPDCGIR